MIDLQFTDHNLSKYYFGLVENTLVRIIFMNKKNRHGICWLQEKIDRFESVEIA